MKHPDTFHQAPTETLAAHTTIEAEQTPPFPTLPLPAAANRETTQRCAPRQANRPCPILNQHTESYQLLEKKVYPASAGTLPNPSSAYKRFSAVRQEGCSSISRYPVRPWINAQKVISYYKRGIAPALASAYISLKGTPKRKSIFLVLFRNRQIATLTVRRCLTKKNM